ncbi:hypothetical protein B0O99DRAFT_596833 [Bisporella sp. PMI_857]|jgi:hypothetical protein|nr:hypothetical protein B0O99DRAFT_596833 [Bisporella sp. PMI_857]
MEMGTLISALRLQLLVDANHGLASSIDLVTRSVLAAIIQTHNIDLKFRQKIREKLLLRYRYSDLEKDLEIIAKSIVESIVSKPKFPTTTADGEMARLDEMADAAKNSHEFASHSIVLTEPDGSFNQFYFPQKLPPEMRLKIWGW